MDINQDEFLPLVPFSLKVRGVCVHTLVHSVVFDSLQPRGLQPTGSSAHGILQARIREWVAFPFSRGSSQPRDRTQVSCTAGGFLPAEPQGSPSIVAKEGIIDGDGISD